MNLFTFTVAAFLFSPISSSNVVDLTLDNFDQIIGKGIPALVEFYAPWCGHCQNLAPTYERLADQFAGARDRVIIAKVDADQHKELGSRFKIKGFPTLKWFGQSAKDPKDYEEGRDFDSLVEFVTKNSGIEPAPKESPLSQVTVLTEDNFDSIVLDPNTDVFVKFFAPWCGHCKNMALAYEDVARDFAGDSKTVIAEVDCVVDAKTCGKYSVTGFPTLKFFPRGSSKTPIDYTGPRTEAGILAFINDKAGTYRLAGGALDERAGRIAELDELAKTFIITKSRDVVSKVQKVLENNSNGYASYYLKVFEKMLSKPLYAQEEALRLGNILTKGNLSPVKADEFQIRRNILKVFEGEKSAKDEL